MKLRMSADGVFSLATWIGVMALAIGVVCACAIAISGKIRDDTLNLALSESLQKTAEAKLKLEELRVKVAARQIDGVTFQKLLEGKPKAPVEIMYPREDFEAYQLALQFRDILRISEWESAEPVPVPPGDVPRLINQPSIASVGANGAGVTLVISIDSEAQIGAVGDVKANSPLNALVVAVSRTLGGVSAATARPDVFHVPPPGIIRIVVGPKP